MKNRRKWIAILPATVLGIILLGVVGSIFLWRTAREFMYPQPGRMPAVVTDDTRSALQRLESALAKYAPEVMKALQPGLSDEATSAIESEYGIHLTGDLKELYRWRNGSPPGAPVQLIPMMRFVSLEEAALARQELGRQAAGQPLPQRMLHEVFAGHRKRWLTVLDDGFGDGYFYDESRRDSAGSFFYCFMEDHTYRFFPSIANFLMGAAECYESEIYRRDVSRNFSEEFLSSSELWKRYASAPDQ
jgi:cell wall assembly regulator SMI1